MGAPAGRYGDPVLTQGVVLSDRYLLSERIATGGMGASAAAACVKWGGSTGGAGYGSPFEHCG